MCEKLLANPLIEDYEVQLLDDPHGGANGASG
jgi:phosphoribosylformylglycinamidine (FGAM) synthase PurS component